MKTIAIRPISAAPTPMHNWAESPGSKTTKILASRALNKNTKTKAATHPRPTAIGHYGLDVPVGLVDQSVTRRSQLQANPVRRAASWGTGWRLCLHQLILVVQVSIQCDSISKVVCFSRPRSVATNLGVALDRKIGNDERPHDVESLRRGSQALCRLSVWDDHGPVSYCGFRAHSSRAPFTRSGLKNCTWLHLLHTAIMKKLLLYCAGDRYCGAVSPSA